MVLQGVILEVLKTTSKYQKSTFVKNLIERRKSMGLSALEFSEVAEIPYPTLRDIEVGKNVGRPKTLKKIAQALNTTIDELNTPSLPNDLVVKSAKEAKTQTSDTRTELIVKVFNVIAELSEPSLIDVLNYAQNKTTLKAK